MRTTHIITGAITAALTAAALAVPAAAVPGDAQTRPNGWDAAESTIKGSQQSGPTTANVYVPPAELFAGNATVRAAGPPAWPANPKPIARPRAVVTAPASGLDWGSAGVGGAAVLGAFAITLAGIVGLRRRRTARPRPLITR
jgi:hypothetical protein